MREDIAKVICERPRHGGKYARKKSHRRQLNRIDEDMSIKGESMHRRRLYSWHAKEFGDFLEPVRGFLKKNAGRPWNKISAELSMLIPKDSVANIHVWSHIDQYVETQPMFFDGRVYRRQQGSKRYGDGLSELVPGDFYVSQHGLMLVYRKKRARKNVPRVERCEMLNLVQGYVKFGGQWYDVNFRNQTLPPSFSFGSGSIENDVFGIRWHEDLRKAYGFGHGVYCRVATKKRLMSKSEVRQRVMQP